MGLSRSGRSRVEQALATSCGSYNFILRSCFEFFSLKKWDAAEKNREGELPERLLWAFELGNVFGASGFVLY
jgi:hypothetical protein